MGSEGLFLSSVDNVSSGGRSYGDDSVGWKRDDCCGFLVLEQEVHGFVRAVEGDYDDRAIVSRY